MTTDGYRYDLITHYFGVLADHPPPHDQIPGFSPSDRNRSLFYLFEITLYNQSKFKHEIWGADLYAIRIHETNFEITSRLKGNYTEENIILLSIPLLQERAYKNKNVDLVLEPAETYTLYSTYKSPEHLSNLIVSFNYVYWNRFRSWWNKLRRKKEIRKKQTVVKFFGQIEPKKQKERS